MQHDRACIRSMRWNVTRASATLPGSTKTREHSMPVLPAPLDGAMPDVHSTRTEHY